MKYLLRLIALPFVLALNAVAFIRFALNTCYLFMRYGGEFVQYAKPQKTIADVYDVVAGEINKAKEL